MRVCLLLLVDVLLFAILFVTYRLFLFAPDEKEKCETKELRTCTLAVLKPLSVVAVTQGRLTPSHTTEPVCNPGPRSPAIIPLTALPRLAQSGILSYRRYM